MKTLVSAFTWIGLLAVVMLSYVACAQQGAMTDATRQQETEMTDESAQWNDQLAQWRSRHEEMRVAHSQHDSTRAPDKAALRRHVAQMGSHEQQVAAFQTEFDSHRERLQEESAKPEGQRAGSHPELWANHIRMKGVFEALARAHDQLAKEHEGLVEKTAPHASRP